MATQRRGAYCERVYEANAKVIRNLSPEVVVNPRFASKLPGDPLALRGLPAIGRGVGGAIRGTNPEMAIY